MRYGFGTLSSPSPPGTVSFKPPAEPRQVRYAGHHRRCGSSACVVWMAGPSLPGVRRQAGPWTMTCDWHPVSLDCPWGELNP
jgi:hypothetical protein